MRKSTVFILFTALLLASGPVLYAVDSFSTSGESAARIEKCRETVAELKLTDLCLFTESRYTRNPTQADLMSAFQDHPGSLEHFPSGSFVRAPIELWARSYALD